MNPEGFISTPQNRLILQAYVNSKPGVRFGSPKLSNSPLYSNSYALSALKNYSRGKLNVTECIPEAYKEAISMSLNLGKLRDKLLYGYVPRQVAEDDLVLFGRYASWDNLMIQFGMLYPMEPITTSTLRYATKMRSVITGHFAALQLRQPVVLDKKIRFYSKYAASGSCLTFKFPNPQTVTGDKEFARALGRFEAQCLTFSTIEKALNSGLGMYYRQFVYANYGILASYDLSEILQQCADFLGVDTLVLPFYPAARRKIFGNVRICKLNGDVLDGRSPGGAVIPPNIADLPIEFAGKRMCILSCEPEPVALTLANATRNMNLTDVVILYTGGKPDKASRRFIRIFSPPSDKSGVFLKHLPDYNPQGVDILISLCGGDRTNALSCTPLRKIVINTVGPSLSDFEKFTQMSVAELRTNVVFCKHFMSINNALPTVNNDFDDLMNDPLDSSSQGIGNKSSLNENLLIRQHADQFVRNNTGLYAWVREMKSNNIMFQAEALDTIVPGSLEKLAFNSLPTTLQVASAEPMPDELFTQLTNENFTKISTGFKCIVDCQRKIATENSAINITLGELNRRFQQQVLPNVCKEKFKYTDSDDECFVFKLEKMVQLPQGLEQPGSHYLALQGRTMFHLSSESSQNPSAMMKVENVLFLHSCVNPNSTINIKDNIVVCQILDKLGCVNFRAYFGSNDSIDGATNALAFVQYLEQKNGADGRTLRKFYSNEEHDAIVSEYVSMLKDMWTSLKKDLKSLDRVIQCKLCKAKLGHSFVPRIENDIANHLQSAHIESVRAAFVDIFCPLCKPQISWFLTKSDFEKHLRSSHPQLKYSDVRHLLNYVPSSAMETIDITLFVDTLPN